MCAATHLPNAFFFAPIDGGDGNDSLFGLGGDDVLDGESDVDTLDGGTNTDTCLGETLANCEK